MRRYRDNQGMLFFDVFCYLLMENHAPCAPRNWTVCQQVTDILTITYSANMQYIMQMNVNA